MASITKAQLRNDVLVKLQVLPSGQAASGDDATQVDSLIDAVFEQYEDILPFTSAAIPLWAKEPVVDIVAAKASPYFGGAPISKSERTAVSDFVEERRVRLNFMQQPTGAEYY